MKKLSLFTFAFCLFTCSVFSQAPPQAFTYSAIAKGSNGQMLANKTIGLQFSILESSSTGTVVYQETQTANTDPKGIFVTAIGIGTPVQGTFPGINWGVNAFFLKVELDENGGTNYFHVGTTQLLSVPYALYAEKSGTSDSALTGVPGPAGATGATGPTGPAGSGGSVWNPHYPDGLDSLTPVNFGVTNGSPYTVPTGQTFYGYIANTQSNMNTVNIAGTLLYSWAAKGTILGAGTVVSHSGADIVTLSGFTVPSQVTTVVLTSSSIPYTVPAGQTFYLTGVYPDASFSTALTVDGVPTKGCYPPNCMPSAEFFVIGSGSVLGGTVNSNDLILGYLK